MLSYWVCSVLLGSLISFQGPAEGAEKGSLTETLLDKQAEKVAEKEKVSEIQPMEVDGEIKAESASGSGEDSSEPVRRIHLILEEEYAYLN